MVEDLFVPNLAELKGKNTSHRPPPVLDNIHVVPDALVAPHRKIPATIDVFWISRIVFLAWVDLVICYRMAPYLKNKLHKMLYKAIDKCLRYYNHNNFLIDTIHCDQEFEGILAKVKDTWDIHLNMGAAQEHCHPAERNVGYKSVLLPILRRGIVPSIPDSTVVEGVVKTMFAIDVELKE